MQEQQRKIDGLLGSNLLNKDGELRSATKRFHPTHEDKRRKNRQRKEGIRTSGRGKS